MRRDMLLITLGAASLAAGSAQAHLWPDGAPLRVPAALDCPTVSGDMHRTAQAADGQSCDYASPRGEIVRLRLVPLRGLTPSVALAPLREQLHALVPVYAGPVPVSTGDWRGDRADVDVPFVHVHADGDRSDVRLFGIFHINAKDHGDDADVEIGRGRKHSVVHAGLRGAEVMADEVGRSNASLVYVLAASHRKASGYQAAGYVAKGPVTGPLVVAEFRSPVKGAHDNENDHGDLDRLIDRNLDR